MWKGVISLYNVLVHYWLRKFYPVHNIPQILAFITLKELYMVFAVALEGVYTGIDILRFEWCVSCHSMHDNEYVYVSMQKEKMGSAVECLVECRDMYRICQQLHKQNSQ